jgi:hypothetical protein
LFRDRSRVEQVRAGVCKAKATGAIAASNAAARSEVRRCDRGFTIGELAA